MFDTKFLKDITGVSTAEKVADMVTGKEEVDLDNIVDVAKDVAIGVMGVSIVDSIFGDD